jgi:hypothetical protein
MNFVEVVVRGFLNPLAVGATFIAPLFVVGFLLHRQKRAYRAAADEPFIQLPLRPPGESLRLRIEELLEEFDSYIYTMGIVGVSCLTVTLTMPERTRLIVGTSMLAIALAPTLWSARKLSRLVRLLWDYRLGFTGERLVGRRAQPTARIRLSSVSRCSVRQVQYRSRARRPSRSVCCRNQVVAEAE